MTTAERSRYFGQVDTGEWEFPDIVAKAVFNPGKLTLTEKLTWRSMCAKVGLNPDGPK